MTTKTTTHMTGAELQTLREACNLSREEFGELARVAPRTVKHWENGRAGVPADVADIVRNIDDNLTMLTTLELENVKRRCCTTDGKPDSYALIRYKADDDLGGYLAAVGRPFGAQMHSAIISRVRAALVWQSWAPDHIRVVWFDPHDFTKWLDLHNIKDTPDARQHWAAQQVDQQAIPHRADQPPQA